MDEKYTIPDKGYHVNYITIWSHEEKIYIYIFQQPVDIASMLF